MLEDRRQISKHGEKWSFFGGSIKPNETPKEALIRELKEELNYCITNFDFFKSFDFIIKEKNIKLTYHMYISKIPDLNNIIVHDKASYKIINIDEIKKLELIEFDRIIINEFLNQI